MKTKKLTTGSVLSCVTVSNMERTKHLFTEVLGLELKDFQPDYNWMEVGNEKESLIGFGECPKEGGEGSPQPGSNAIVSIGVENLEEAMEALKAHHIEFLGDIMEVPGQVKMVLFQDFDGNRFFLCESLEQ